MKTNSYNYDALNNTLTMTKAFARKASQLNTSEYKTLLQLRNDNPGMKIVMKESNNKSASKNTASGITFKQMETFISQCRDSEPRLNTYERVKALSKVQRSPYKYVKDWFLTNYANYADEPVFDEDGFVIVKTKAQMEQEAKEKAEGAAKDAEASRDGTVSDPTVSIKADNKAENADENECIITTFVEESENGDSRDDTNSEEATTAAAA